MNDLIAAFMAAFPTGTTAYYEEAPPDAGFPFCIVASFDVMDAMFGNQISIDIDFWTDEGSGNAVALETLCNTVKAGLDRKTLSKSGEFRAVVYFENQQVVIDGEQDLIRRRQTYIVRAFFM